MRIILHIGANKTGTTAIQEYLTAHRKQLARHGILWPETGLSGSAHYKLSNWLGFGQNPKAGLDPRDLIEARDTFRAEIAATAPHVVLLSSEFFMLRRRMDRLQTFFEGVELEVWVSLRRHDTWWPSLWAQAIKTVPNPQWGRSLEGFIRFQKKKQSQHTRYRALVETWDAAFPGCVRAVPFEPALSDQNMVANFMSVLGLGDVVTAFPTGAGSSNVSPRLDALSLIDFLQRSKGIDPAKRNKLINQAIAHGGTGTRLSDFVSGNFKAELVDENAEDYGFLSERFAAALGRSQFFAEECPREDGRTRLHQLLPVPAFELLINSLV